MNPQIELRDQVVLITGASRGLGAALARAYGHAGARVALCARSEQDLERVSAEVRSAGATCLAVSLDIRDDAAVRRWVATVQRELGAPATVVNNASVLGRRVPLAEHELDEWRNTLDVNLTGAFSVIRSALPALLQRGAGSIINVSSGAAVLPRTGWGAYSLSKHALEGLTLNLAEELKGTGVRVNTVDPGAMRTQMRAAAYPAENPAQLKTPDEATPVFLWLASDAAREVTGQRFHADDWVQG
jgi:NAD(P)-dependent dehydrogenase (short-subunit alcohol dehydrogenase family)